MRQAAPELDRYLLGDNPFIGVDHLSQERARERAGRLDTHRIVEVIDTALESGAQGLLFSTHPIMYDVLKAMKRASRAGPLNLYPLLPNTQAYLVVYAEKGMLGLAQHVLAGSSLRAKAKTLARGFSLASMDPIRVVGAYVDMELDILRRNAPDNATLKTVFLHEIFTDLATSFRAGEFIRGYAEHVLDKHHVKPGFATRNFPRFVQFVQESGLALDDIVILTPFNKLGFQMNPSREACERTLSEHCNANVIVMSILASGYLTLHDALDYLKAQKAIRSFVVGASTRAHAAETFRLMRSGLG
jgi:hypothetical protein